MKRLLKLSGPLCTILLALGALALLTTNPAPAVAQTGCGVHVAMAKDCQTPRLVGQTDDCTITLTNQDACGNTYQVNSGSDVIHANAGDVTDSSLPISAASAGTPASTPYPLCSTSSGVPCVLGVGGSVTFHDNNYTIVVGDVPGITDTGTVNMTDLCDSTSAGCASIAIPETATAATVVQSCSVTIDKQISCDGGVTWAETGAGDTGNGPCTGFTGDPIQVRYIYQNTGSATLNSCVIHDVTGQTAHTGTDGTNFTQDTSVGTISSGGSAITSSVITTSDGSTPLTCNAAGPNYDTANIDCVCGTTTVHADAHDTANFSCESCSVQIDKQVSCAGAPYVDVFPTDDSVNSTTPPSADTQIRTCTGYDAYTGHTADNIAVQYVITNTGTDSVHGCTYSETNSAVITGSPTTPCTPAAISDSTDTPATLTSSQTTTTQAFTHACSPGLVQCEVSGQNTATIGCTCDQLTNNSIADRAAGFHDTAGFNCLAPGLNVTKTCDQQSGGLNHVTVTATNTSTDTLLYSCVATDTYDTTGACTTSSTSTPYPNTLALTGPASVDLGLSGSSTASQEWTADLSGLSSTACNNGAVTCHLESSTGPTISANFNATCPVSQGCETRTPGFWKTHPDTSYAVMQAAGGAIQSCGLDLNNVMAGTDCSAIEDMCSLGQDAAKLGINPVQANLIFQCAAAELNLAVTQQDGGDCGATIPNSTLTFAGCCGLAGSCATADQATLDACQNAVSAFNAQYDTVTLTSGSVLNNPGADPTACQTANGNGYVNDPTAIGSSVADCGGARMYLQKSTGGGNPHNASSTNNGQHNGQNK